MTFARIKTFPILISLEHEVRLWMFISALFFQPLSTFYKNLSIFVSLHISASIRLGLRVIEPENIIKHVVTITLGNEMENLTELQRIWAVIDN